MTNIQRGRADEKYSAAGHFHAIADIAPVGIFHTDANGDVTYVNQEWCRLGGMTPEAAMGKGWVKAIHPDDRKKVGSDWYEAAKTDRLFENEYRYVGSDGAITWCSVRAKPELDESGDVIGYVGALTDISERRQAEKALRQSDELFRVIIENSPAAIILKDLEGRFQLVNSKFEEWFGISASEVIGKMSHDVHREEDAKIYVALDKEVMAAESTQVLDRKFLFPDGVMHSIIIIKFPVRDETGQIVGIGTINTDITKLRKAEEQLHQAQKMEAVGQLTGGIAHDFNNSLAIILGNADMLTDDLGAEDARVQAVLRAATRAADLTQRLLAFSRQQPLHPIAIDPGALAAGMIDMLRRSLGEAIDIEFVLGKGLWTATADPSQLENALLNLAINARDAMSGAGTLVIETDNAVLDESYAAKREGVMAGDYVVLAITDTGTGMPPEVLEHVFEPFFTTKAVGKGTGLGLSMVFGFARQSGGHVAIYSEQGKGTTVKLYLPRTRDKAEPTTAPANRVVPRGRGETVLVVEDDGDVREFTVMLLERLGYQVLEARDGKSGLAVLEEAPGVDLLLTDMVMAGGMSGRDLADEAARRNGDLKVLFMSGYTEAAINLNGWVDKGADTIQKPFRRRDLATKVRGVLDRAVD